MRVPWLVCGVLGGALLGYYVAQIINDCRDCGPERFVADAVTIFWATGIGLVVGLILDLRRRPK